MYSKFLKNSGCEKADFKKRYGERVAKTYITKICESENKQNNQSVVKILHKNTESDLQKSGKNSVAVGSGCTFESDKTAETEKDFKGGEAVEAEKSLGILGSVEEKKTGEIRKEDKAVEAIEDEKNIEGGTVEVAEEISNSGNFEGVKEVGNSGNFEGVKEVGSKGNFEDANAVKYSETVETVKADTSDKIGENANGAMGEDLNFSGGSGADSETDLSFSKDNPRFSGADFVRDSRFSGASLNIDSGKGFDTGSGADLEEGSGKSSGFEQLGSGEKNFCKAFDNFDECEFDSGKKSDDFFVKSQQNFFEKSKYNPFIPDCVTSKTYAKMRKQQFFGENVENVQQISPSDKIPYFKNGSFKKSGKIQAENSNSDSILRGGEDMQNSLQNSLQGSLQSSVAEKLSLLREKLGLPTFSGKIFKDGLKTEDLLLIGGILLILQDGSDTDYSSLLLLILLLFMD